VDTLITVVKDSIKQARVSRTSETKDLQVATVQLILQVASKTAGGRLDFCVLFIGMKLSLGTKVTRKDTHTIDITLVPPEELATRQVRGGDVEDVLVNAIATIRDVTAKAPERATIPGSCRQALSTYSSPSRIPEPSPLGLTTWLAWTRARRSGPGRWRPGHGRGRRRAAYRT
jgi:hypothetical protein